MLAPAQSSDEKAWVQRLGYILEKIEPMDDTIAKTTIDKLSDYLATQRRRYISLANEQDFRDFQRNKRWNIIENTTIESDL